MERGFPAERESNESMAFSEGYILVNTKRNNKFWLGMTRKSRGFFSRVHKNTGSRLCITEIFVADLGAKNKWG